MLTAFLDGPQAESYGKTPVNKSGLGKTTAITVVVLTLLKTHLHAECNSEGHWHVLVDKPTVSDGLLTPIVQKLLALPAGK